MTLNVSDSQSAAEAVSGAAEAVSGSAEGVPPAEAASEAAAAPGTVTGSATAGRPGTSAVSGAVPASGDDRRALIADVLNELNAFASHSRVRSFKTWHRGALSLIHLHVLSLLEAEGPLPMSRLAEELDVSDASVTGIVDRMERRGLVERRHATDDRRIVAVHPTDRGATVFTWLERDRRARLARLLDELTEEELAGFLSGVRGMRRARASLPDDPACGPSTAGPNEEEAAPERAPTST